MKKEYKFKIGDRVKIIDCIYGNHCDSIGSIGKIKTITKDGWATLTGSAGEKHSVYNLSELELLKPSKKVTKPRKQPYDGESWNMDNVKFVIPKEPVKKVKPKELYLIINITKRENGYELSASKSTGSQYFVFNTKARLIKWVERNI